MFSVIDRRAVPGLLTGTAGLVCSVAALVYVRRTTARLQVAAAGTGGHDHPAAGSPPGTTATATAPSRPDADGITDAETGLFSEGFFVATLEKRVSAARRALRPLAVVLLEVVEGEPGGGAKPVAPRAVAGSLLETLRDADTTCRLDDGGFAVVLEDTNETGAVWTVERMRRRLVERDAGRTVWAGVACYPAHAFDAAHIVEQSRRALDAAKDWNQHRIEVAALPED